VASRIPGVASPVIGLPDVHFKARNPSPTGVVVAVDGGIVPLVLDSGVNCGMRVHVLDLGGDEINDDVLDRFFAEIRARIALASRLQPTITDDELEQVLARGAAWVFDRNDGRGGPAARVENEGALPVERPRDHLFGLSRRRALRELCVLGGGNHFLELHVVDAVLHPHAELLGLREGGLLMLMHTGSGPVGKKVSHFYGPRHEISGGARLRLEVQKVQHHAVARGFSASRLGFFRDGGFRVLDADGFEGRRFLGAQAAAANFGYANRAAIGAALQESVASVFGSSVAAPLLYDLSHVLVQRETHNGRDLYVHRHGANRAFSPALMAGDDVFAVTGQPFPVPGSMGSASYICVGRESGAATYYSANHGAGRTLDKPQARETFKPGDVRSSLASRRIRLFQGGSDVGLTEQAPGAFKDISAVIDVMQETGIAHAVVRTRPLATLKG
jgi:tRNA-splicing ligase RtcB (3'-phosphate/5'-hydroxy nucleic acid ligase)